MKYGVLIDKFWVEESLNWFIKFNLRILYKKRERERENSLDENEWIKKLDKF